MESDTWTYADLSEDQYKQMNDQLAEKDTLDVLKWAYGSFGDDLVYACSFGAEGMVLIDLISKVRKDASIVFLDTHLHFKETYQLIERVKERYPSLNIQILEPDLSVQEQAEQHGPELWKREPDLCCHMRKIQPLEKALSKAQAWVSGLRREQSPSRAHVKFVNQDHRFQSIKICPLVHWSWDEIWNYIKLFNLDYNELHDQNYPSIGCEMCTLPVQSGQDSREGRWANAGKTECGLHA